MDQILAVISREDLVYFVFLIFLVFLTLMVYFIYGIWAEGGTGCPSPYTDNPLRRGSDIHWMTREKVLRYLFDMRDYNNRMFDITKAAYCRDTGRIFPDANTWYGGIKVDWNFIQKRYPGKFVSWGSLTEAQKLLIEDKHESLEGFQTRFSSSNPSPRDIEQDYAYTKPGPLYVDLETGVLLGWKSVPDTELEVMIVQKPLETYIPGLHKKY